MNINTPPDFIEYFNNNINNLEYVYSNSSVVGFKLNTYFVKVLLKSGVDYHYENEEYILDILSNNIKYKFIIDNYKLLYTFNTYLNNLSDYLIEKDYYTIIVYNNINGISLVEYLEKCHNNDEYMKILSKIFNYIYQLGNDKIIHNNLNLNNIYIINDNPIIVDYKYAILKEDDILPNIDINELIYNNLCFLMGNIIVYLNGLKNEYNVDKKFEISILKENIYSMNLYSIKKYLYLSYEDNSIDKKQLELLKCKNYTALKNLIYKIEHDYINTYYNNKNTIYRNTEKLYQYINTNKKVPLE